MAWLAVDKDGNERIFHNKPIRERYGYWEDKETYAEIRAVTTSASDYSIYLPKGTIKKLINKVLTWDDEKKFLNDLNYDMVDTESMFYFSC